MWKSVHPVYRAGIRTHDLWTRASSHNQTRGQFHKTLQIRKLRICSCGQILTVNLTINCKNSIIYGKMAINYEEKSFMEQAPGLISLASNTYEGLMVASVLKDQLETKNWENDSFQFFRTYLSRVPISLATNLRVQSNATETFWRRASKDTTTKAKFCLSTP